ncbi:prepilin-type N-terminal cleavage/methylation domain-containing protein [Pseudomonas sp. NPDC078416]|uniref:prepilin-type N-terminal cleavage/methylation domain-containing protein n=1 Tax=Pseudomonas sp. NPDC078416 TaxID=3390637 RepID=UPI003CFE6E7B
MNNQQRGFTLLEIMIVLSLLAVLLTLVGGALVGANRAVVKADHYTSRLDERRAAQSFLRQAISQALPLDLAENAPSGAGLFVGSAQRVQFAATLPGNLGGGIQLHTLEVSGPAADRRLQIAFAQVEDNVLRAWGDPQVLLHGVRDLTLRYRGVTPKGEPTGWLDEWPWPNRLPRAVRVEVQMDGPVTWPSEIIALRLDLSGGSAGAASSAGDTQ